MFSLSDGQVDLWFVQPEECRTPELLEQYRRLLDEEETQSWLRYRVERKRHEHLVGRALLRTVLSHYVPIPPGAWRFSRTPAGKPFIAWENTRQALGAIRRAEPEKNTGPKVRVQAENESRLGDFSSWHVCCDRLGRLLEWPDPSWPETGWRPTDPPPLEFNLSHTDGLIVCAVASGAAVGVDVEDTHRPVEFLPLARRFFAPSETAFLESLPAEQLPKAFYRLWTLKEAYLKARGTGLAAPLESFSFQWLSQPLPEGAPGEPLQRPQSEQPPSSGETSPQLVVWSPEVHEPTDWQFREFCLEDRFQLALAVRCPAEPPLRLTLRKIVPLQSHPVVS